jgi:hypothetical protein
VPKQAQSATPRLHSHTDRERGSFSALKTVWTHALAGNERMLTLIARRQLPGFAERHELTGKDGALLPAVPEIRQSIIVGTREIVF